MPSGLSDSYGTDLSEFSDKVVVNLKGVAFEHTYTAHTNSHKLWRAVTSQSVTKYLQFGFRGTGPCLIR
jgi:hypothetical protein